MPAVEMIVQPPPERVRRLGWMVAAVLALVAGLIVVGNGGLYPAVAAPVVCLAAGLAAVRFVVRSWVRLVPGALGGRTGLWGWRSWQMVATTQLAAVVEVPWGYRVDGSTTRTVFVLDEHGRAVLRMRLDWLDSGDIERVIEATGLAPQTMTAAEFVRTYPSAVAVWERRRAVLAVLVLATAVVAVIVVFLLGGWLRSG